MIFYVEIEFLIITNRFIRKTILTDHLIIKINFLHFDDFILSIHSRKILDDIMSNCKYKICPRINEHWNEANCDDSVALLLTDYFE